MDTEKEFLRLVSRVANVHHEIQTLGVAIPTLKRLSDSGNTEARTLLASAYEFGIGVLRDIAQARENYEVAARFGDTEALYCLGRLLLRIGEFANARTQFEAATKDGHIRAAFEYAKMLESGQGGPKDEFAAFENYHAAAVQGYVPAVVKGALCYRDGIGTETDVKKMKKLLRVAAGQEDATACYELGLSLLREADLQEFPTDAIQWIERASTLGLIDATRYLGEYFALGKHPHTDPQRGLAYLCRAEERGSARATYLLAVMTALGVGAPKDLYRAFDICKQAADAGVADAEHMLAEMYRRGDGIEQSPKQYRYWLERAANNGHERAIQRLASISRES